MQGVWPLADLGAEAVTAGRRMFRYVIGIDDQPHVVTLTHDPVAAAAIGVMWVEFWAEHDEDAGCTDRTFQVFGTGQPLPDGARWIGTCARAEDGFVWHLYELGRGAPWPPVSSATTAAPSPRCPLPDGCTSSGRETPGILAALSGGSGEVIWTFCCVLCMAQHAMAHALVEGKAAGEEPA
jgi:hypothetical protein